MAKQTALGLKSQTRRLTNLEAVNHNPNEFVDAEEVIPGQWAFYKANDPLGHETLYVSCPYGQAGDQLVARERSRVVGWSSAQRTVKVEYSDHATVMHLVPEGTKYDDYMIRLHRRYCDLKGVKFYNPHGAIIGKKEYLQNSKNYDYTLDISEAVIPWKPSIFMPLWMARTKREIVSIRPVRLATISREDAIAEGIEPQNDKIWTAHPDPSKEHPEATTYKQVPAEIVLFQNLWAMINGHSSWDKNPWVWRVEFEKGGQQ